MKIAFFDRDGTIIKDYADEEWKNIKHLEFFSDSFLTLREVLRRGYSIIVITNQYIINEGIITIEQYNDITKQLIGKLSEHNIKLLDIFYCPHGREEGCNCIKPKTGMIQQALDKYPTINLNESFFVGDSIVDVKLAEEINIKGFGIGVDYISHTITKVDKLSDILEFV